MGLMAVRVRRKRGHVHGRGRVLAPQQRPSSPRGGTGRCRCRCAARDPRTPLLRPPPAPAPPGPAPPPSSPSQPAPGRQPGHLRREGHHQRRHGLGYSTIARPGYMYQIIVHMAQHLRTRARSEPHCISEAAPQPACAASRHHACRHAARRPLPRAAAARSLLLHCTAARTDCLARTPPSPAELSAPHHWNRGPRPPALRPGPLPATAAGMRRAYSCMRLAPKIPVAWVRGRL